MEAAVDQKWRFRPADDVSRPADMRLVANDPAINDARTAGG
jgi:hypothetical protein